MSKTLTVILLMMFALLENAYAKSLGVVGSVFPVAEMSFLKLIESRVDALSQNGVLDDINRDFVQRVSKHADRPQSRYLERASTTEIHFYTPEIVLSQTIMDYRGRILYPAGTRVNALEKMPTYKPCWMFFNGDDKAQVLFVKRKVNVCQNLKLILTQGSVSEVEHELSHVIYFDQNARITKKINIKHLPAIVERDGSRLKITEYAIKEDGNAI